MLKCLCSLDLDMFCFRPVVHMDDSLSKYTSGLDQEDVAVVVVLGSQCLECDRHCHFFSSSSVISFKGCWNDSDIFC